MRRLVPAFVASIALLSGCSAPRIVPHPAQPVPVPRPVPPPVAVPTPAPAGPDWRDWAVTPGNWSYRQEAQGSVAQFGVAGAAPTLTLRCDRAQRRIALARGGGAPSATPMTIRTTAMSRTLTTQPTGDTVTATLTATDPLLDAMGYSRGRFIVEQPGVPALVVPAWAEVLRVIEDCRG